MPRIVEIYYGLPADFGAYGKGLTQHMIRRSAEHLLWNVEQLAKQGAQDIRWFFEDA